MSAENQQHRMWAFAECARLGSAGGWRFREIITAAAELANYISDGTIPAEVSAPEVSQGATLAAPSRREPHTEGPLEALEVRVKLPIEAAFPSTARVLPSLSPVSGLDTETVAEPAGGVNALAGEG